MASGSTILQQDLGSIDRILDAARNGKMFVIVDDVGPEYRGALVIPAQMATPSAVNFMARHGRGLICLALEKERAQAMGLPVLNKTEEKLPFTVSIEARTGVTTGISAADRARTISAAIDGASRPDDLVTPGHVFPLVARQGGVLDSAGLPEAAVDISRLAGLNPSGVVCDILSDSGAIAAEDDLSALVGRYELLVGRISDLMAYRLRQDRLVDRTAETVFNSRDTGTWRAVSHRNRATGRETLSLIKGKIDPGQPTLVRLHGLDLLSDLFGNQGSARAGILQSAMEAVAEAGAGIIVVTEGPLGMVMSATARRGPASPADAQPVTFSPECRSGAQVLSDLGVIEAIVLTASDGEAAALAAYGLGVVDEHRLCSAPPSVASLATAVVLTPSFGRDEPRVRKAHGRESERQSAISLVCAQ